MAMTSEDMDFKRAAGKYQKCKQEEESRHLRHKAESTSKLAAAIVFSSDESSDESSAIDYPRLRGPSTSAYLYHRDGNHHPNMTTRKRPFPAEPSRSEPTESVPLPKRCILHDPLFNAALDRTKTSTRQAMLIVTPALAAAGVDVGQITLSRTSLMEGRKASREALAATVRQNFQPKVPLVAHFDGKLLRTLMEQNVTVCQLLCLAWIRKNFLASQCCQSELEP